VSERGRAAAVATLAGVAAGWLAFAVLVWLYGESPREIAGQLLAGTWGMAYGVGQVLYKATPLLLTGVAVSLALRAGLFNIGGEGQLAVAGLAVGAVGASLPRDTPAWVALPAVIAVAPLAGAAWAGVPAVLRARYGAHEVISTIMMNRIADAVVGLALARGLALPGTVRTGDVAAGARLPRLEALGLPSLHGSAVSLALPLALAVAFLAAGWLARSRVGRETVLVGLSPSACAAERIPVARRLGGALILSGAVAGLASLAPVLGSKGYFESGMGAGAGFGGIAVALLGRGSPMGLFLAALLFGTLEQGGLAINARVPMEVMTVLQGVVIVAVALADARVRAFVASGIARPARPRRTEATG
jgi:simple sugar transport system permease protein